MFKKKAKKDQCVLFKEEYQNPDGPSQIADDQTGSGEAETGKGGKETTPNQIDILSGDRKEEASGAGSPQNEQAQSQPVENFKRSQNSDILYLQDSHSNLQNEPQQRQVASIRPPKSRAGVSINNVAKNEETSKLVHDAFEGNAFRAGNSLIKDMEFQADELEEEAAKRKYLDNIEQTKLIKEGKLNTKMYRGMNAYANHRLSDNDIKNASQGYKKTMGPSRINSTIKNTCRFDYVLNLCKDWHDSGYCPFGNSCLYLHDRSNVKTGWELEKDFEQQERQRWKRINNPDMAQKQDREKLLKTIEAHRPPSNCENCLETFKDPVEVECGHIFCSACALKLLKCKTCNKRLSGIMNNASAKLAKQGKTYDDMLAKLESEKEENHQRRRKFENTDSIDVFAD